ACRKALPKLGVEVCLQALRLSSASCQRLRFTTANPSCGGLAGCAPQKARNSRVASPATPEHSPARNASDAGGDAARALRVPVSIISCCRGSCHLPLQNK